MGDMLVSNCCLAKIYTGVRCTYGWSGFKNGLIFFFNVECAVMRCLGACFEIYWKGFKGLFQSTIFYNTTCRCLHMQS